MCAPISVASFVSCLCHDKGIELNGVPFYRLMKGDSLVARSILKMSVRLCS